MSDNTRNAIIAHGRADRMTRVLVSRTSNRVEKLQADRITAGGARRDRTDDLLLAKQALSQLSYGPAPVSEESWVPSKSGIGGPGKI